MLVIGAAVYDAPPCADGLDCHAVPTVAPYGSWRSPIDAGDGRRGRAAARRRRAGRRRRRLVGARGGRPRAGAAVLMRRPAGGEPEEVTPEGTNVRTRVHEYGGGAWTLVGADLVLFVDFADQRALPAAARRGSRSRSRRSRTSPAACATPTLALTPGRRARVVCVREVHGEGEAGEPDRRAAARRLRPSRRCSPRGRDFYSFPRVSPDGALARLDLLGPPEHALGRDRAVGGAARRPGAARLRRRRARGVDLPARVGRRRAGCTSSPTATAGGTSTGSTARRRGEEPRRAADRRAGRPRPPAVALRRRHLRLPRRRLDRLRPLPSAARNGSALLEPGGGAAARPRPPLHRLRLPVALGRAAARSPSPRRRPASETAVVVYDVASGELEDGAHAPATSRSTRPTSPSPRAIEFPTSERRHRPRLLLPAGQRRVRRRRRANGRR